MGGLRPFQEAIIMTVLFGFCILAFSYQFLSEENPGSEVIAGDQYGLLNNTLRLNHTLAGYQQFAEDEKAILNSSAPAPVTFVFLIFEGAFRVPWLFLSTIANGMVDLGVVLYSTGGGGGWGGAFQVVIAVVLAMLLLRLILYIISAIRSGNSER